MRPALPARPRPSRARLRAPPPPPGFRAQVPRRKEELAARVVVALPRPARQQAGEGPCPEHHTDPASSVWTQSKAQGQEPESPKPQHPSRSVRGRRLGRKGQTRLLPAEHQLNLREKASFPTKPPHSLLTYVSRGGHCALPWSGCLAAGGPACRWPSPAPSPTLGSGRAAHSQSQEDFVHGRSHSIWGPGLGCSAPGRARPSVSSSWGLLRADGSRERSRVLGAEGVRPASAPQGAPHTSGSP